MAAIVAQFFDARRHARAELFVLEKGIFAEGDRDVTLGTMAQMPVDKGVLLASDRDLLDHRHRGRSIPTNFDARDLVDRLHRPAFAEDRVAAIEMQSGVVHDEKLGAVGIRTAIGHAQEAGAIVIGILPNFIGDDVTRFARSVFQRIATLNHEALDDAVKHAVIVRWLLVPLAFRGFPRAKSTRETDEVRDRDRCFVIEQLAFERSHVGFNRRRKRFTLGQTLGRIRERPLAFQRIIGARFDFSDGFGRNLPLARLGQREFRSARLDRGCIALAICGDLVVVLYLRLGLRDRFGRGGFTRHDEQQRQRRTKSNDRGEK